MKKPTKWGILKFASFLPIYFLRWILCFFSLNDIFFVEFPSCSLVDMALISNASFMEMTSSRNIKKLVVMAAIFCLLGEFWKPWNFQRHSHELVLKWMENLGKMAKCSKFKVLSQFLERQFSLLFYDLKYRG